MCWTQDISCFNEKSTFVITLYSYIILHSNQTSKWINNKKNTFLVVRDFNKQVHSVSILNLKVKNQLIHFILLQK